MLIVLGGRPGTGKTTQARLLAQRLTALHLRIDSLEQALRDGGMAMVGAAGYGLAQRIAADNLRLGLSVIADCVNPVQESRMAWRAVAAAAGADCLEIELVCSDAGEHRRRIETRQADIPGHRLPRWETVQALEYQPWPGALTVDTAGRSAAEVAETLGAAIRSGNR